MQEFEKLGVFYLGRRYDLMKETQDIRRAAEEVEAIDQQIAALDADLQAEIAALDTSHNPATARLETIALKPKRGDVAVQLVALAWQPAWEVAGP